MQRRRFLALIPAAGLAVFARAGTAGQPDPLVAMAAPALWAQRLSPSIASLQRALRIGHARACRIMGELLARGELHCRRDRQGRLRYVWPE